MGECSQQILSTFHLARELQEPQIFSIVPPSVVMGRQGQAVGLLVGTLIHGQERVEEDLRQAILTSLAAVAADDPGRLAIHEAGGVPLLIKLMNDGSPEAVCSAPVPQ